MEFRSQRARGAAESHGGGGSSRRRDDRSSRHKRRTAVDDDRHSNRTGRSDTHRGSLGEVPSSRDSSSLDSRRSSKLSVLRLMLLSDAMSL